MASVSQPDALRFERDRAGPSRLDRPDLFPRGPDDFHSVVVVNNPSSVMAEAVRGLRTRIMAQHVQAGRRALAVCGATQDSGCTFVAANLAVALAQIGVRTALVDADLRHPSLDTLLGVAQAAPGLSDYLADDRLGIHDVVGDPVVPCLSFVAAGSPRSNPQELLATARFAAFASQLLREHQITIFDTTAANGCTDAQRVATVAGYSLVVARKDTSFVSDLATLARLLRADGSKIVGSVLVDY
ncbi:MAG TPA: CpsD/CapB family tyrosine-protein kinase [Allosphingosinicella sp.]|jgi:capsular exopolysaccharide synthesis family protein